MQREDFEWFKANMPELYKEYGHCYLAIKDKGVIGVFPSYGDGVRGASAMAPLGSFIVQECGETEAAYTNYIASAEVLAV